MNLSPWRCRFVAAFLILGAALLRLVYLANNCPLDLAPDEAHYWDWSRHLDWSYYSKGPLIAWLIRLSCELFGPLSVYFTGTEVLAVRIPAVVFGSLLLAGLYVLTVQVMCRETLALAVVAIGLTMPMLAAASSLMTIDSPYTCLWCWALVVGYWAIFGVNARDEVADDGTAPAPVLRTWAKRWAWTGVAPAPVLRTGAKRWAWPVLGLLVGVGVLAKYTMVLFVPFLGLFLLTTPTCRVHLRRPGFWLMAVIASLCCLPIALWNWQHDWVTLRHTGSHAGVGNDLRWLGPLRYLATQFAVLLGFWFIVWARSMWAHRPGRENRPEVLYLWWLSAPMFAFFGLFSLKNGGGEPNWPATAYIAGMVLAAGWLARELQSPDAARRRWTIGWTAGFVGLGLLLSVMVHRMVWVQPVLARIAGPATPNNPTPVRRFDPTARLRGRLLLAKEIDALREELRQKGKDVILAAVTWTEPGEIGFYCADQPQVYCLGSALGERHSQYDLWRPNPVADADKFRDKTFLIVGARTKLLEGAFERIEEAREVIFREQGEPLNRWDIVVGYGYRGFQGGPAPRKF